jgi:GT2 family glycosyltransferase
MRAKVAALVSMYKAGKYVVPCLENLTRQTLFIRGDLEILLLDAASPDREEALCRSFVERYPDRIRYFRLDRRLTLYET